MIIKIFRKGMKAFFLFFTLAFTLIFYSCEKKSDTVIDPTYASPIISNPHKSTEIVNTNSAASSFRIGVSVFVSENGGGAISSVKCKVLDADSKLAGEFLLSDSGSGYDTTAGDGRYSAMLNVTGYNCLIVGQYTLQFLAENVSGLPSNQVNSVFAVTDTANVPPVISNPVIPDSVVRPASGSVNLTLQITVTDANGDCDISQVWMDAYRPTGNYIGRNPLLPQGNNIFTLTAPVTPATADSLYGYYKYEFQAVDRSNAFSIIYKDSIKFVRP